VCPCPGAWKRGWEWRRAPGVEVAWLEGIESGWRCAEVAFLAVASGFYPCPCRMSCGPVDSTWMWEERGMWLAAEAASGVRERWVAPIDPVKGEWELAGVGC
jgi:hypothetical protein